MIAKDIVNVDPGKEKIPTYIRRILSAGKCMLFLPTYFHPSPDGDSLSYTVDRTGYRKLVESFSIRTSKGQGEAEIIKILSRVFSAVSGAMYQCIMPEKYVISGETVFYSQSGLVKMIYMPASVDRDIDTMTTPSHRVAVALSGFVEDCAALLPYDMKEGLLETYELMKASDLNCQDMVSKLIKGSIRN